MVVVGGGPGGSAAALALARRGRSVVLLERCRFPRFHIGESLLPMSAPLLAELGLSERIAAEGFVTKRGATFLSADGRGGCRIDFTELPRVSPLPNHHVSRDRFDALLLDAARAAGVEVREEARALEVDLGSGPGRPGRPVRVSVEDGGVQGEVTARVLVDASGRHGLVARRLGLRVPDPALRRAAVHARLAGPVRCDALGRGDVLIVSRGDLGWLWGIPLAGGVTSVGAVFEPTERDRAEATDPAALLARLVAETPAAAARFRTADLEGARFESDWSYGCRSYAGARWLLVGDAGSFLDPVFSTGVHLALRGALEAAEVVDRSLRRSDALTRALARRYHRAQLRRYRFYRRLVTRFYRPSFRELFFHPEGWPAGFRSVATVLAGVDRPAAADRLRLEAFYVLGGLMERFPRLVPPPRPAEPLPTATETRAP